jgi:hypothetical protein
MISPRQILSIIGVLGPSLLVAQAQSPNRDPELDLGVKAYKNAKYEEAIYHFEKAVGNEPTNVTAHLYLATAYAQNFIPGVDLTLATKKRKAEEEERKPPVTDEKR